MGKSIETQPKVDNSTKKYKLVKPLIVRGELSKTGKEVELNRRQADFARKQGCIE